MQKYNYSAVLSQNVNMASKMAVYAVFYRADMIYILFLKLIVFELIMSLTAWECYLYLKSNIVAI